MSVRKVRCSKCRGQKKYVGIGGITKDCIECDGTGTVEQEMPKLVREIASPEPEPEPEPQPEPVKQAPPKKRPSRAKSAKSAAVKAPDVKPEVKPGPIFPGYDDEFMRAILDEPKMDPLAWAAKYKHVDRLFGMTITGHFGELTTKVQRAGIRESYAMKTPMAPRVVDLSASQDAATKGDSEYASYQAKEKKALEEQKKKKAGK